MSDENNDRRNTTAIVNLIDRDRNINDGGFFESFELVNGAPIPRKGEYVATSKGTFEVVTVLHDGYGSGGFVHAPEVLLEVRVLDGEDPFAAAEDGNGGVAE
ncbi:hypothetical protein [Haladaptatus salinisoli]|uniref:hypothetical protein n=1 Tax=Haladaptatus salinisoli TaxID=2884876 RepID=UPI001D0B6E76|nr:hypothetical protein [Haladaptatus salinisoli]